jgi:hypothetical protein
VVDIVLSSPAKYQGFVRQEQFSLPSVLDNRFGKRYAQNGGKEVSAQVIVTGQTGQQRAAK